MANTLHTPGLVLTEHEFSVPLDHDRPDGEHITVFAREVADLDGRERPFLVFFQGGPGYEATRPTRHPDAPSWLDRALQDFRVLMLDQRGTGRSTPVGTLRELAPDERAAYLSHFRADSIVRDAEWIRGELGVDSWSILGQSFGGFCVTTYLSFAPEGLREAFITGGLPPMGHHIDEVYRATYQRALERNHRYFERYPGDREHVRAIHQRLESHDVRLPSGDRLTSRRLRQLGMLLGMSDGFEQLHYILELPFASPGFLHDVEAAVNFARNPLYAVLHEACYGDGYATQWSADRMLPSEYKASDLFTGEHIYPWLFEDCAALAPLRKGAEILAAHTWPPLYDGEQLRRNEVPTAAVIYAEDM
ncbi:MAG TPA: alpha/beta fold hydrolase, partial [Actinomycetota bacterium]|nr:alpha/beta fold hydrolase [Actinomycetota bacterium]